MNFKIAAQALAAEVQSIRESSGARRCRLPRSIWEKAGALAQVHGVDVVAKAANLSPKPIIGYLEKLGAPKPNFVEVVPGFHQPNRSCRVRLEAPGGRRMEIRFAGVEGSVLNSLLREFLA